MRKLLIATTSTEQCDALARRFQPQYETFVCTDGASALALLHSEAIDVLILDLVLPQMDGITVLQEAGANVPQTVLMLSALPAEYVQLTLMELGVGYIMMKPCSADAIASHIERMERFRSASDAPTGMIAQAAEHLRQLGLATHLDGYHQLRVGIPLFAQDPEQHVFKELYANVATICGNDNPTQVEHSMRVAIKGAWNRRDEAIWSEYFQRDQNGSIRCPSNKVFIAKLAERLA